MKILLIYPPAKNMILANLPSFVEEGRGFSPPLGLMYIAAYAEQNTNYEIRILDMQVENIDYHKLKQIITKMNPDIVGIQVMTFTLIDSLLTAKVIKSINKDIKVVFGGPHVNIYPIETINFPEVDYVVLGEGEITFTKLIKNFSNIKKLKKIKGLVFKDKNKIIYTGKPSFIKDLDSLPFPARHLTKYKKYFSLLAKRSLMTTIMTSRGCPYKCLFCDRPHLGKIFRARSAKNVVDEIEECVKKYKIKEFLIYDDTFTIDRQRVIDICDGIKKRNLRIGWDIRARVDTVDEDLLKIMKKAGCERIHYGIESGNQEILNILRKGITLEQAERAIKLTKKAGIDTLSYFMIGSPKETKKTIFETINFAKKINTDFCHFAITTPYPVTDLYRLGLQQKILKNDYWAEFARNPTKDFIPSLWEENLSREELIELLRYAYKSFYIRLEYIIKGLSKIKSFTELKRKSIAGLRIIKLKK